MPKLTVALLCSSMRDHAFTWLRLAKMIADEIVVLTHACEDDTEAFFMDAQSRGLVDRLESLPLPHLAMYGFAAAKNKLMSMATGDWVMFIDDDEAVHPAYMHALRQSICNQSDDVGILTVRRRNVQSWPKTTDGHEIPRANWEEAWYYMGKSHYLEEPQHKVLRNGVEHAGIIHEEPGGMRFQEIPVVLMHMCLPESHEEEHKKHRLYMWLIKQCVDHPERRRGVNSYWYTRYYAENKAYVDKMAKEFESDDRRFCGYYDG